ncbi:hypothetical protein SprV_0200798600 [Sparganum proliferum]
MVRQPHDGMTARVQVSGAIPKALSVTRGAKQGYVLAPILFSLMFSAMLVNAYRDDRPGIHIAYRADGHFLTAGACRPPRHYLRPRSTTCYSPVTERCTPRPKKTCNGAWTSSPPAVPYSDKAMVIQQLLPNTQHSTPLPIHFDGNHLQTVNNFACLGSTLSCSTRIDDEVVHRITKAGQAFCRLQKVTTSN